MDIDTDDDMDQPVAGPSQLTHSASQPRAPTAPTVDVSFDLDDLSNLEQHFYDTGYADGFAHGRIHGLIEGRQLGREKGFEIWEEVGFYEAFARTWKGLLLLGGAGRAAGVGSASGSGDQQGQGKALLSISRLLALVERFPTTNPTPTPTPIPDASTPSPNPSASPPEPASHLPSPSPEEVDMTALLARMRAQYRTLCAVLGVKPRMAVAQSDAVKVGRQLAF